MVEKEPLEPLSEQENEDLWAARQDCRDHIPHSLPRLLTCVRWSDKDCVAQVQKDFISVILSRCGAKDSQETP